MSTQRRRLVVRSSQHTGLPDRLQLQPVRWPPCPCPRPPHAQPLATRLRAPCPAGLAGRGDHKLLSRCGGGPGPPQRAPPPAQGEGSDAEYEGDELRAAAAAAAWQPDPLDVDARRPARARRGADIIAMLVAIFGSKELFIAEYRRGARRAA
jgi:hypothetical protein